MEAPVDAARKALIKAAMIEELGTGRMDTLPMEDRRRDEPRRPVRQTRSRGLPPAQQPRETTVAGNLWNSAIASGLFDDEDAEAVKGLDDLGGGRLHANRAQQVRQHTSNILLGLEKHSNAALHYQRKGKELPPGASMRSRDRPALNQPNLPHNDMPIRAFGPKHATTTPPLRPATTQHNTLGNGTRARISQSSGKPSGAPTGPKAQSPAPDGVFRTPDNVVVQARVKYDNGKQPPVLATLYLTSAPPPHIGYFILVVMNRKMCEWSLSAWSNYVVRGNDVDINFRSPNGKEAQYLLSFKEKHVLLEVVLTASRMRTGELKGQKVAVSPSGAMTIRDMKPRGVPVASAPSSANGLSVQVKASPKAAESKPAESKPAESKPAESKPAENKPAESITAPRKIKGAASVQPSNHIPPQNGTIKPAGPPIKTEPPRPVPELIDFTSEPRGCQATEEHNPPHPSQESSAIQLLATLDSSQFAASSLETSGDTGTGEEEDGAEDEARGMLKHLDDVFNSMIELFRLAGKAGQTIEELTETAENIKHTVVHTHRSLAKTGAFFPKVAQPEREKVFAAFLANRFELPLAGDVAKSDPFINHAESGDPGGASIDPTAVTAGRIEYTDVELVALKPRAVPAPDHLFTLDFLPPPPQNIQAGQAASRAARATASKPQQNSTASLGPKAAASKEAVSKAAVSKEVVSNAAVSEEAVTNAAISNKLENKGLAHSRWAGPKKGLSKSKWADPQPVIQKAAAFTGPGFEKYPRNNGGPSEPQPAIQMKTEPEKYPRNSALADLATLSSGNSIVTMTADLACLSLDPPADRHQTWK